MDNGFGFSEVVRVAGPKAMFVRMDIVGMKGTVSLPYFIYQDGGMKVVDFGLCRVNGMLDISQTLIDYNFIASGDTFTCTIAVPKDTVFLYDGQSELTILHRKGTYLITVDINTLQYVISYMAA